VNCIHQPAALFRFRRFKVCKPVSRLFNFLIVRVLSICDSSISAAMFLINLSSSLMIMSDENVSESSFKIQLSILKTSKLFIMTFIAICKYIRILTSSTPDLREVSRLIERVDFGTHLVICLHTVDCFRAGLAVHVSFRPLVYCI